MATPPYPAKARDQMPVFFDKFNHMLLKAEESKLKENYTESIEAAIFAHFEILRIHPFPDCNGRTARVMQNAVLKYYGLPPATISRAEKIDYLQNLHNALKGHDEKKSLKDDSMSEEEKKFYNYIACKVNHGMDELLSKNRFKMMG